MQNESSGSLDEKAGQSVLHLLIPVLYCLSHTRSARSAQRGEGVAEGLHAARTLTMCLSANDRLTQSSYGRAQSLLLPCAGSIAR